MRAYGNRAALKKRAADIGRFLRRFARKYALQPARPGSECIPQGNAHISVGEQLIIRHDANDAVRRSQIADFPVLHFANQIPVIWREEINRTQVMLDPEAEVVAKCHLADRLRDAKAPDNIG